jgi:hypothetical protein
MGTLRLLCDSYKRHCKARAVSGDTLTREITTKPLIPQQAIMDTVRDPLLVLDRALNVKTAGRSFLREVASEAVGGQLIYDILDGTLNVAGLSFLLEKVISDHTASKSFKIEKDFPRSHRRRGARRNCQTRSLLHHNLRQPPLFHGR